MMHVRTEHVLTRATPAATFRFLSRPENTPRWATNFISGLRREGPRWVAATPLGDAAFAIEADERLGIADQILDGRRFPIRVVPVPSGTLVTFTLLLPPELPPPAVEQAAEGLREELANLRRLLDAGA